MGMTPDEIKRRVAEEAETDIDVGVWPENWAAFTVFEAMRTQWRSGFSNPTGLDYAALPFVMRRCKVLAAQQNDVFSKIRMMEADVLTLFSERAKANAD